MHRIGTERGSFYLERLPELGKSFETSLITGEDFIIPRGWEIMDGTRLPKFMYQLFSQLLRDDGSPRFEFHYSNSGNQILCGETMIPSEDLTCICRAVQYIRQVCMMWSKVETFTDAEDESPIPSDKVICAKNQKALDAFIQRATKKLSLDWDDDLRSVMNEARRLLRCVFTTDCQENDELMDFVKNPWGRHGPGAVAGREVGPEKWSFNKWPGLPSKLFSWRDGMDCEVHAVERQDHARLCMVPKDYRGPRIICIEPKENQFGQQGLMDILYRLTHRCTLTKRSISFYETDESRRACYDYRYATIDLKDASDTINLVLARYLLPRWVFKLVTRYRSREIITPTGLIKSRCLATMGNATCFPLETLLFWSLSLGAMIVLRDSYPTRSRKHLNLEMRVFGDDIIVPLWSCDYVARVLEAAGLLVNTSKTCSFSLVRESCGEWVFAGKENKIARFHSLDVADHRSFMQWRDLYKDLGQAQLQLLALHDEIRSVVQDYINSVRKTFPKFFKRRWNPRYQRFEVYAPVFVQQGRLRELSDAAGLYAWHVHNDRTPYLKGARKRVYMRWQAIDALDSR
jgi:hypothetical protein